MSKTKSTGMSVPASFDAKPTKRNLKFNTYYYKKTHTSPEVLRKIIAYQDDYNHINYAQKNVRFRKDNGEMALLGIAQSSGNFSKFVKDAIEFYIKNADTAATASANKEIASADPSAKTEHVCTTDNSTTVAQDDIEIAKTLSQSSTQRTPEHLVPSICHAYYTLDDYEGWERWAIAYGYNETQAQYEWLKITIECKTGELYELD